MNRDKVVQSTHKVFSLDAFDSRRHDLLLSEMDKALKSEKKNFITACGVNGEKATLITLQFETEDEFSKAFAIFEKYAKSKNAETGSLNQEKTSEMKSEPKQQAELGLNKTGDVPFGPRASGSVSNPNFASHRLNANPSSGSQSSSVQDSSSITVLTLTNGDSSSSYTGRGLTLLPEPFTRKDGNLFGDDSFNGSHIPSLRENQKQLLSSSPTFKNFFNPLPPVKIVRRPEKRSDQGRSHRRLSLTSESSSETDSSLSGYRTIPVQRLNSRIRSSSSSDSSSCVSSSTSGYCETCCSSGSRSSNSTVHFYKGVEFIIPQCSHQHFNSTIDNVWVYNKPVDRRKPKITSYHQKPWLCFH